MTSPLRRRLRSSPLARPFRLARVGREARTDGHPDWPAMLGPDLDHWMLARASAAGARVLIATDVGLHFGASRLDSLLAVALTLRGAQVDVLLCDGVLPACMAGDISWFPDTARFVEHGPQADFCRICFPPAAAAWARLGITPQRLGDLIEEADRPAAVAWADGFGGDVAALRADPLADQALAGTLRFFARSRLPEGAEARAALRRFLAAAHLARSAARRLAARERYDVVVLHHGIYVPQGPVLLAAQEEGARVVTWNPGYRKQTFIFSHDDSYHHTMIAEPAERWQDLPVPAERSAELDDYLRSRRIGSHDWIVFGRGTRFDGAAYLAERGVDPRRPVFLALTNVAWDAQLHYPANGFGSMMEWLVETVRWFASHPELQLVVRIHPAEITGTPPAEERSSDTLAEAFPQLPPNVVVVQPDDPISTYALIESCHGAIVYATKAGIEVAAMGKPLIVAGEAWARGKGFSLDARDPDHYRALLESIASIAEPGAAEIDRARRYAFHYFFRRMIPVRATEPAEGWPPYRLAVKGLADLAPGADPGLDVICDGILDGRPFEYPAGRQLSLETAGIEV